MTKARYELPPVNNCFAEPLSMLTLIDFASDKLNVQRLEYKYHQCCKKYF